MSRTFRDSLESDLATFFSSDEFAREFTLSRGVAETSGVAAVTATRVYERVDSRGNLTAIEAVDFDLPASSYLIDGEQVAPAAGDRFGDGSSVWEVFPVLRRQCFEALDGDGLVIRVHTQRVVNG